MLDKLECRIIVAGTFPLGTALPVQADTVIADLCVALAVYTSWLFFPAFNLPIFARPVYRSARIQCQPLCNCSYQHPLRLRVLGSALPGFFGLGIV